MLLSERSLISNSC